MKTFERFIIPLVLIMVLALTAGMAMAQGGGKGGGNGGGRPDDKGPPNGETAGNNLSYPVIWAEGIPKALPGEAEMTPRLEGEWWYQWGTNGSDPNVTPASCPPDPDEGNTELNLDGLPLCDDGIPDSVDLAKVAGLPPAQNPLELAKAFLQKNNNNEWQAGSADWPAPPVNVNWIDWGDNLESVDWYTKSMVRTEVVLFQDLDTPMTEYEMRHTSGWGIDEVHGLAASLDNPPVPSALDGNRATVYSPCARFTIQKLLVGRDDLALSNLVWVPEEGWTELEGSEVDLINPPIFNGAVHEAGDGPGYYNAEINVKGRIIYGYTWNVKKLNEGAGDYRLTFSFDEICGDDVERNTLFDEGTTQIMVPLEEVEVTDTESEPGGGAVGVLDFENNLTYIDVRILERNGGGNGGGKGGGKPGSSSLMTDEFVVSGDRDQLMLRDRDPLRVDVTPIDAKSRSDVNQDGQVDILDLALVASRLGSDDPLADLNGDGAVNVLDLVIVARHFN